MQDRSNLALPPEMAKQVAHQQKIELAGRQLLESLACAIYVQLAADTIRKLPEQPDADTRQLCYRSDAEYAMEAAFPMAAQLGWHFQAAPPGERDGRAPESPTCPQIRATTSARPRGSSRLSSSRRASSPESGPSSGTLSE